MFATRYKVSLVLSVLIAVLAVAAAAGGLFIKDLYRDNEFTKTAWQGNDLVTLCLAVPTMLGAMLLSLRDSKKAQLVWMGTLWYMVYNYMFYLYAAAFNSFFLVYVALFTFSTYALIFALIKVDAQNVYSCFSSQTPVKVISALMLFFAVLLGVLWIGIALSSIMAGEVPAHVVQTGHPTGVVYATDLSLLVPALLVSASLLWKRRAWGYVLSVIVLVKSVTYGLVLLVMSVFSYHSNGTTDPFVGLWAFLSAICVISLALLLRNMHCADAVLPD